MKEVFRQKLVFPEAVTVRYDPFLEIEVMPRYILSNMQTELFEEIVRTFVSIGITRFTTSRMDPINYPRVKARILDLGLKVYYPSFEEAKEFVEKMDKICKRYDAEFSVCCDPNLPYLVTRLGCIDGRVFNAIKERRFPNNNDFCITQLHNKTTGG